MAAHNSKQYWTAHKDTYEDSILGPMTALLAELEPEFGEGKVFRPYRDVRFSADKSPYKTNIAAHNGAGYISLSAQALGVGCGLSCPHLTSWRNSGTPCPTTAPGGNSSDIVADLRRKKLEIGAHEVLKSAPRRDPERSPSDRAPPLQGHHGLEEWSVGSWLRTKTPKQRITDFLHASEPLRRWLHSNVD